MTIQLLSFLPIFEWILLPNFLVQSHFYNFGQNICRISHVLAQFLFTTSDTEPDYYQQEVNVRVALRVVERLNNWDFMKFVKFKKIPEMLGVMFRICLESSYLKEKF